LIQKLQQLNQADALFRFQDSFLEGNQTQSPTRQYSPMMIIIPDGPYVMGYVEKTGTIDPSLTQKLLDETEIKVRLKRVAISRYEVTVSNYAAFLTDIQHDPDFNYDSATGTISYQGQRILSNVCDVKQRDKMNCSFGMIFDADHQTWQADADKSNYPITSVSWYGAHAYSNWLSQKTGFTYRLPTEVEWEYAARADSHTLYWWGNQIDTQQANFNPANMIRHEGGQFVYRRQLLPVDSLLANPWGLYHVHGNASEWTCSAENRPTSTDWQTCALSEARYIIRGGSWRNAAYQLRATFRRAVSAMTQQDDLTF
jgi:formylglycine-generating enzyme required for sulfatase activity